MEISDDEMHDAVHENVRLAVGSTVFSFGVFPAPGVSDALVAIAAVLKSPFTSRIELLTLLARKEGVALDVALPKGNAAPCSVRAHVLSTVHDALCFLSLRCPGSVTYAALDHSPLGTLASLLPNSELPDKHFVLVLTLGCVSGAFDELLKLTDAARALALAFSVPATESACIAVVLAVETAWYEKRAYSARPFEDAGFACWSEPGIFGYLPPMGTLLCHLAAPAIDQTMLLDYGTVRNPDANLIASQRVTLPVPREARDLSTWQPPTPGQQWTVPPRTLLPGLANEIYRTGRPMAGGFLAFLTAWSLRHGRGELTDVAALLDNYMNDAAMKSTPSLTRPRWFSSRVELKPCFDTDQRRAYVVGLVRLQQLQQSMLKDEAVAAERATLVPMLKVGDPLAVTACAFGMYVAATALQRMLVAIALVSNASGTLMRRTELASVARLPEIGIDTDLYTNVHDAIARLDSHFGTRDWDCDNRRHMSEVAAGAPLVSFPPPTSKPSAAQPLLVRLLASAERDVTVHV